MWKKIDGSLSYNQLFLLLFLSWPDMGQNFAMILLFDFLQQY